jgi:spore germination protein YaaH
MHLQRFLHLISALAFVIGTSAITNESAPAQAPASVSASASAPAQLDARGPLTAGTVRATAPSLRREVFGFGLASSLGDPTYGYPSWNFSLLSTVAFFGLHINWDGTIVSDSGANVWNSSTLTGLLSTAHGSGTKVVLTIVLQDFAAGTPNMCAGLINRSVTVRQAVAQVAAKGVDGLNVDYEGLNGTCQNGETAQAMMTDFARQLRAALPSGSYLSVDTYASSAADSLGFYDIPGLDAYVDSFFVMAYDLEYSNYHYPPLNCVSFCLGPTAPLTGYHYNDTTTASQYAAVVSASKVILGVPYYGRKSCVAGAVPNAYPSGSVTADSYLDASGESTAPGVSSFATHRDANDPAGQERWDTWFNSSMNCTRELYWDDAASLGAKYDLINSDNLRGVGIWTLNYGGGAPELWSTLANHFAGCKSLSVTANPPSAPMGTAVTLTASASGCTNPLYQFWVLPPGGSAYQLLQAYSTSSTYQWTTSGKTAGTYVFSTWVRDSASQGTYGNQFGRWDAYNSMQFNLVSSPCSSASVSFSPSSPTTASTPVNVTAHAAGCPNPLYQFWVLPPGASAYQLAQAYSSASTLAWNTAARAPGTYVFSTWVRDASSTGTSGNQFGRWDAYSSNPYVLTGSCSGVTVSFAPGSPAAVGTSVSVTAHASGCGNPTYQFWILPPNGTAYQLGQAYSSTATFTWSTANKPGGTYVFSTWVRDASSPGAFGNQFGRWDAYNSSQYALESNPCASVSVSFTPAASATSGTSVTATAQAAGCPHPLYEFWVLPPGGTAFQLGQAYSSNASFTWDTSGKAAGTYVFSTWVRDAGSAGAYGNQFGRWDAYNSSNYLLVQSCTAVTVTSASASPAAVGTTVTITVSATGCAHPLYQLWVLAPGGTAYQLVQAYSSNPTLTWSTTGDAPGVYQISIWARDANSPGTSSNQFGRWDAYDNASQFTLESSPCSSVSVSFTPASSATAGTSVTATAQAAGCPHPLYQFWVLPPGGTAFLLGQSYSSNASFTWDTSGKAGGTYVFSTWVRDAGSSGTYGNQFGRWDAYNSSNYVLVQSCTAVTVTSASASPAAVGTTVTFTVSATGCAHPLYQLWVLAPGGTAYQLVQAYSSNATLTWSTTGDARGVYQISIWARDANSPGTSSNQFGRWDAYDNTSQFTLN